MKEEAMTEYKKFCRGNGKPAPRMKIIERFLQRRRRQRKLLFLFARLRALLPQPHKRLYQITGQHIPALGQNQSSGFNSSLVQANHVNPRESFHTSTCSQREKAGSLPDVRVNRLVGSNLFMIQIMTSKELGLLSSLFSVLENEDLEVLSAQTISMTDSKIFHVILVKFLSTTEMDIGNVQSKLYSVASGQAEIVSNSRMENGDQQDINKTG